MEKTPQSAKTPNLHATAKDLMYRIQSNYSQFTIYIQWLSAYIFVIVCYLQRA